MTEPHEQKRESTDHHAVDHHAGMERVLVVFCTYNEFENLPQAV